jgi:tetratricopeptide (TPR) repeat protein
MNLLPLHWLRFVPSLHRGIVSASSILLVACASTPAQPLEASTPTASSMETELVEEMADLPLSAELIYYVLTAEIAGQRGKIGIAAELYDNAANLVDSPAVAGRSTQVANFSRNQDRINRAIKRWIEVDPTDADIYIMQAPFLMLKGDYDGVIKAVDSALEWAPEKSKDYLDRVSGNLIELAKPEQALNVLQQLKTYQQNDIEAIFAYARMAAFHQRYDDGLLAIEKVLKEQPKREDALILKAELLQRLEKGAMALAVLKKPATDKAANDELRFSYAKLLGENNKISEAKAIFQQLNTASPENEEVLFALGLIAIQERDGQQAKQYFNELISLGDSGKQAGYFMGLAEELNNDKEAAKIWFVSVPAESPRFQAAQSSYINLLADDGQMQKARMHLKLLRREQPKKALQYYIFEGSFLRERGQGQAAFDLYSEALKKHSAQTDLLYGRAMVAESLNKIDVLEEDLRAILDKEPNNSQALNALGYTLADRTNRHQEALSLINKAVELKPNDAFYLDSLAWVHYRLVNLDDAERFIKQAVVLSPAPEFSAHLGEILWAQGKQEEAKKAWNDGLKMDSNNQLILDTMSRFGL